MPYKLKGDHDEENRYKCIRHRFILTTPTEKFEHPHIMPEDEWRQKVFVNPKERKKTIKFLDEFSEWSDFPEEQKPTAKAT